MLVWQLVWRELVNVQHHLGLVLSIVQEGTIVVGSCSVKHLIWLVMDVLLGDHVVIFTIFQCLQYSQASLIRLVTLGERMQIVRIIFVFENAFDHLMLSSISKFSYKLFAFDVFFVLLTYETLHL